MSGEREHHLSKKKRFEILVIPQHDAGKKRSVEASATVFLVAGFLLFLTFSVIMVYVLGYTPLRRLVPVSDEELQRRYGSELVDLQTRLSRLTEEFIVMREYNLKLRSALGEKVKRDSTKVTVSAQDREERLQSGSPAAVITELRAPANMINYQASSLGLFSPASFKASFPISSPVSGYITRSFDVSREHYGTDFAGKRGAVVSAVADGYVIFSAWTFHDGYIIMLSHGGGYLSSYKHNQAVLRHVGELVKRGEPIALLGNSGKTSSGPHLHLELWKDGRPQNPEMYLLAKETLSLN
jgi:murein DD-endopeptidase MepM/ murein hydrolase activator NlpD